jgi:hypothetical protein
MQNHGHEFKGSEEAEPTQIFVKAGFLSVLTEGGSELGIHGKVFILELSFQCAGTSFPESRYFQIQRDKRGLLNTPLKEKA